MRRIAPERSMSRLVRSLLLAVAMLTLAGCATYPSGYSYRYDERAYYAGDRDYYAGDYYRGTPDRYGDVYWHDTWWPYYSLVLRPVYSAYYDPWYTPGFYYGVTYFPRYHGLGWASYGWPYGFAYSPYRYSWWDNYYDWSWHQPRHRHARHHGDHDDWRPRVRDHDRPRFGSEHNAYERVASRGNVRSPGARESFRPQDPRHGDGIREPFDRPAEDSLRPYDRRRDVNAADSRWIGNPRGPDAAPNTYRAAPRAYSPTSREGQRGGGYAPSAPRVHSPSPRVESRGNSGGGGRVSGGSSSPRSSGASERGSRDRDPNPN
jgi:hypothetical protein